MNIRILLADDHTVLRDGLRALLSAQEGIEVVGDVGTGREAVALANRLVPDVVVMDIAMPDLNGVDATRKILSADPKVRVIALSTHTDKQFVLAMLEAGASGYVMKAAASDELMRAIEAVTRNRKYLSPDAAAAVVDSYTGKVYVSGTPGHGVLSDREREVLQLLAEGNTSQEIANALDISIKTVDVHRQNIMRKLDLHTIAALTKYAVRNGLTSL